jgi:PhoH-like ATPase
MPDVKYTGYQDLVLTDEQFVEVYSEKTLSNHEFVENEYLIARGEDGEVKDKFRCHNGKLEQVKFTCFDNTYTGQLKPRNVHQELAFDMLKNRDITVKLITGTWGTGKTLSLVVAALEAVQRGQFERVIWIRNNVQVKDTDKLGALPGDEFDKLLPYLGPMMDHVGGEDGAKMLVYGKKLEVIPLAFLRGRSIKNAIIISSEAENLTKEHIQLLLGRVDEGSNLWMDADLKQRDKEVFEKSAGIEKTIERLKGEPLFGYVHLVKSERSATARLADKLND